MWLDLAKASFDIHNDQTYYHHNSHDNYICNYHIAQKFDGEMLTNEIFTKV